MAIIKKRTIFSLSVLLCALSFAAGENAEPQDFPILTKLRTVPCGKQPKQVVFSPDGSCIALPLLDDAGFQIVRTGDQKIRTIFPPRSAQKGFAEALFVAEKNAANAGFADRISVHPCNVLDETTSLPTAPDAVWMSQFLDCFSLPQVTKILTKVHSAAKPETNVYVLEPLWDKQRFEASSYSLQATSLYFTCMANGTSKMYRFRELVDAVEAAGFALKHEHHNLGSNSYSLLVFRKKA